MLYKYNELIARKTHLEKELSELSFINLFDDDNEPDEDAYQEQVKQTMLKNEIKEELSTIDHQLNKLFEEE